MIDLDTLSDDELIAYERQVDQKMRIEDLKQTIKKVGLNSA